jgi:hypothetical protein
LRFIDEGETRGYTATAASAEAGAHTDTTLAQAGFTDDEIRSRTKGCGVTVAIDLYRALRARLGAGQNVGRGIAHMLAAAGRCS